MFPSLHTTRHSSPFGRFGSHYGTLIDPGHFLGRNAIGENISLAPHSLANVSREEQSYEIEVVAPGFEKNDFDIQVHEHFLVIKAERSTSAEQPQKDYLLREYNRQVIERSFTLPPDADTDKVTATYENGILHLSVGRKIIEGKKVDLR
jgi:HSP20 family protein